MIQQEYVLRGSMSSKTGIKIVNDFKKYFNV